MVRVGITGATGFVGGALVPFLGERGYDLVLVDDHSGPIRVDHSKWPALLLDFASEGARRALVDCDVVLHLAAVSGVMACAQDPARSAKANVDGTRALVDSCHERHVPLAFASSLSVVGSPEQLPVTETTPPRPTHEYARQKADGERITMALAQDGSTACAVMRMSNIYGSYFAEGRTIAKGNVLTIFLQQAKTGRLTINAPGTQRRDFIHLSDALAHWEAAVRWLLRPSGSGSSATFNVATGESFSVLEIADKVRQHYAAHNPLARPLVADVVPNPREGIELVDPEFVVSREWTEKSLGVRCRRHVDDFLDEGFAAGA